MDTSNTSSATSKRVLNENYENAAFTSELCKFLTSLAKTPGGEYNDLALDLSRLREALLNEVETSTRGDSYESEGSNESASSSVSDHSGMSASEASRSSPLSSSSPRSRMDSDSSGSSSPHSDQSSSASASDQSSASTHSYPSDLNSNRNQYLNYYTGSWNRRGSVHFTLESGARYELVERDIRRVFSQYGRVREVRLFPRARRGLDGKVEFVDSVAAKSAVHRIVEVGQCRLYTLPHWDCLNKIPVPHQILLESRYLPNVWEKEMVLRSFFNKFGLVEGVVFLGYTDGKAGLQRFVISFHDSKPAQDLIGSSLKILSSTVFVKEVTQDTIQGSSGTSYCPW